MLKPLESSTAQFETPLPVLRTVNWALSILPIPSFMIQIWILVRRVSINREQLCTNSTLQCRVTVSFSDDKISTHVPNMWTGFITVLLDIMFNALRPSDLKYTSSSTVNVLNMRFLQCCCPTLKSSGMLGHAVSKYLQWSFRTQRTYKSTRYIPELNLQRPLRFTYIFHLTEFDGWQTSHSNPSQLLY